MTSEEIDPRAIKTIHCPQCRLPAIVTSTEREVAELEPEDLEGMTKGQRADYERELAMGGGDNWSEVVETATCQTCHVTLTRRTLGSVETISVFDPRAKPAPLSKAKRRATPDVERRPEVASAKKATSPRSRSRATTVAKKSAKKSAKKKGAKRARGK
jgi:hypothetical protein